MRKAVRASTLAILAMAVAGFGAGGCGVQHPVPFDPVAVQVPEREASRSARQQEMYPLPTTLHDLSTRPSSDATRSSDTGPAGNAASMPAASQEVHLRPESQATTGRSLREDVVVRMPLQDIIQRAVLHSHEVQVAGFDPAIAKTRILEAEGRFDPTAFVNAKYEHQDQPFAGQAIQDPKNPFSSKILDVERGEIYTLEPGIKQTLPSGGDISLSYQFQYNYLLPQRFVINPYWDNELKFQLTQPLLRNFGFEVNQARITVARNDRGVSVLDYRKALEDNLAELEKDYWQLFEAEREVLIQEELLKQTRTTAEILFKQFVEGNQGVSRVQTSQAQASIRSREAVLIRARSRMLDISDDMKRRMNDPDFPVAGETVIMPVDPPTEQRIEFVIQDQINTALANRFELGQQLLRINSAIVAERVSINNMYPKLDLQAAITLGGIAGNQGNAFHTQWEEDGHVGWSLGFALEMPIGNQEARAIHQRSVLQHLQAMVQYKNLVEQIALDVKQAVREVETSWNEIGARRQARFAQADQLIALEQRVANGEPLTPTFVQLQLDTQERLADAQREEALAVASYSVAIARLERAKGTLLRYNNVMLAEDQFERTNRYNPYR